MLGQPDVCEREDAAIEGYSLKEVGEEGNRLRCVDRAHGVA